MGRLGYIPGEVESKAGKPKPKARLHMVAAITLALLIGCLSSLSAQQATGIPVALDVYPATAVLNAGSPENTLQSIIRGTIELTLSKRGFTCIRPSSPKHADTVSEFELSVGYILDMDRVVLTFSLSDIRGLMAAETGTLEQSLDPQFDQVLEKYVERLLAPAERELAQHPRTPPVVVLPVVSIPTAEPAHVVQPDFVPLVSEPEPDALPGTITPKPRVSNGIEAGLGGFLPQGRAAGYFTAGGQGQVSYDIAIGQSGLWRARLMASFISFSVEGLDAVRADNLFAMLGAGLRLRLASLGAFLPYMTACAGPAVAMLHGAQESSFTEFMPFGSIALGTRIGLNARLGLNLELASILFLDLGNASPAIVWGFVPRLGVAKEL